MANLSSIEWTDATWNPVSGCTIVSPGCSNCYAMRMAARLQAMGLPKYARTTRKSGGRAVWTGKVFLDENSVDAPLAWRKPRMIFVNSMSDLFHESIPDTWIARVWDVMKRARQHTFQVLTKRPDRMAKFLGRQPDVLTNVWVGTSVESPAYLNRLDEIRSAAASIRFVSFEPLLEEIRKPNLKGFAWVIVGGESGPRARSLDEKWVWELHAATKAYGGAFFFKQWGGPMKKRTGRTLGGRIWSEMPDTPHAIIQKAAA